MRIAYIRSILLLSILLLSIFSFNMKVIAGSDEIGWFNKNGDQSGNESKDKKTMVSSFLFFHKNKKQEDNSSEINMYIDGNIPTIKVSNWTNVNLIIVDRFGIDWINMRDNFTFYKNWIWPIFRPGWRKYLGPTSLKLEVWVVEGNSKGWHLRFNRSTITKTWTRLRHKIQLQAMVDDSTIDYNIVAAIKCTRYDVFGRELAPSLLYLPLKAIPLSNIHMNTTKIEKIVPPKNITNFQFDITNEGNYREMFGFKVESSDGLIANINTPAIVLDPRETKKVDITVLTPSMFIDFGTPRRIDIYAYSYETNATIPLGSITVVTQGVYISPLGLIIAIPVLFIFILIYIFYRYLEKRKQEVLGKPTKPWLIPEEREYLRELKRRDPEEYRKTISMMKQEYKSAILWYKSSIKGGILSSLKDILTREVEVSLPISLPIEKKKVESKFKTLKENLIKEIPEETKKEEDVKLKDEKQLKKEKLMKKIQKQQEKQRRKLVSKIPSKM